MTLSPGDFLDCTLLFVQVLQRGRGIGTPSAFNYLQQPTVFGIIGDYVGEMTLMCGGDVGWRENNHLKFAKHPVTGVRILFFDSEMYPELRAAFVELTDWEGT